MENNTKIDRHNQRKNFSDWLEFLQQESWQLELIISSILLLILSSSEESIKELLNALQTDFLSLLVGILTMILFFIKTNLVVHITFRGLWIGCIGLRYVSNDIDFEALSYADRFKNFLNKKVKSFDDYIELLERISSIIFSYSFLMVFHFISFCIFVTFLLGSIYFLGTIEFIPPIVLILYAIIMTVSGLLNFIDFLTLGWLKKRKWTALIFYPFYRIYNFLSLSFLYRPLHYNFIDNRLGRRYMLFMIPYMLILLISLDGITIGSYNYMPLEGNQTNWIEKDYYNSLRGESPIYEVSIDKLNYTDTPIELFIQYKDYGDTEECLKVICPDYIPADRNQYQLNAFKNFRLGIEDGMEERKSRAYKDSLLRNKRHQADLSLNCIAQLYTVSIDSIEYTDIDYAFYKHTYDEKGLLTYLDISQLSTGKHNLHINIKTNYEDKEFITKKITIPFFTHSITKSYVK